MSQDTLSDVLRGVRLRGAVFFYVTGSSEWAAEAPSAKEIAPLLMRGVEHVMEYHAVAQGSCWAGIPDGPSVQLFAGDVVMFPHGDAHVVSAKMRCARRRRSIAVPIRPSCVAFSVATCSPSTR